MIRIATIGTSMITSNFVEVLNENDHAAFVGTLSRDPDRASSFTSERGGTQPFTSLDDLVASDDVDAVYIASPNALHHDQALACIRSGKHVLVEKPFCANRREAAEVFNAASAIGVVALEAMRPLHDPAFRACEDALPELGRIRRATLRFGKYSSRYDDLLAGKHTNIFDCRMATGSLMDMGVYSVACMVELFGAPDSIACAPVFLDEDTQELTNGPIDGAGVILARYPDMVATLYHSKISADLATSQIEGEAGTLTIHGISCPDTACVHMRAEAVRTAAKDAYSSNKTSERALELPLSDNTMCYELSDFVQAVEAVEAGTTPEDVRCGQYGTVGHFHKTTLNELAIMDEARRQADIIFPADARP